MNFGLGFSGTGGANFSSVLWMGGIGDMIVSKHAWNDVQISEYFAIADKDVSTLSYYDSQIFVWLRPGTYPELIDVKGNVPSGELVGGSSSDFKHVGD